MAHKNKNQNTSTKFTVQKFYKNFSVIRSVIFDTEHADW